MNFIDHTGHIFSIKSYDEKPIGYEYEETKYVFWFDTESSYKLSVNNYYFKPIRIVYPDNNVNVNISVHDKSRFRLLGSKQIQDELSKNTNIFTDVKLKDSDFKSSLSNDDLSIVNNIIEKTTAGYYKTYFVYDNHGKLTRYNGDITKRDNTYYGNVNFGPFNEEVELVVKKEFVTHDFDDLELTYIETNRELTDTDYYELNPNSDFIIKEITKEEFETTELTSKNRYAYINLDGNYYIYKTIYQNYSLVTFYCILYTEEASTWETNVLININDEWCPITVGAEVVDECAELIINGTNTGVSLPKDIIKAVYGSNYNNEYVDERLYNIKLKEYLLNIVRLRHEIGNFRSAIDSLKWFGWNKYVTLNKLWKTDNTIQTQYIRDNFDIVNDNLYTYEVFRNSTYISLSLPINTEKSETQHNFTMDFWGEAKPEMENLLDKLVEVKYDEGDITFYRNYFDYTFDELGLKLCALKYYYNKFFLPIHIMLHSTSMEHRCHMNDIKFMSYGNTMLTEQPVLTNLNTSSENYTIKFPAENILFFSQQIHYIDSNYCEFNNYRKLGEQYDQDIYYINDTVINVPISFEQTVDEQLYQCHLILQKDNIVIHECDFSFVQKIEKNDENYYADNKLYDTFFRNFVIHPKTINSVITGEQNEKFDIYNWVNSDYIIYLCVNNKWYTYKFNAQLPELDLQLGKLEYQYYLDTYEHYELLNGKPTLFNQINGFYTDENNVEHVDFNNFMYQHDLVTINNTDFIRELVNYSQDNNLKYIDGSLVANGAFYYYLEIKNIPGIENQKIVFMKNKYDAILRSTDKRIYEIYNTNNIRILKQGNGRYTVVFKDKKQQVTNLKLQTSQHKTIETYINQYYTVENNFISNKYLNRIHLFDLYDENNKLLKYDENADNVKLYKTFFDNDGTSILDKKYSSSNKFVKLSLINGIEYDTYLMHNDEHWYILLISVDTIKNIESDKLAFKYDKCTLVDLQTETLSYSDNAVDNNYYTIISDGIKEYKLKFVKSDSQIMVNRLQYVKMNNVYHYEADDIIVCSISNDRLPFKLRLGSKWTFEPMSIKTDNAKVIQSPTEMAIVSIGNENSKYPKGYYNITCNYSFDDFIQHSITKTAKFRVSK